MEAQVLKATKSGYLPHCNWLLLVPPLTLLPSAAGGPPA